MHFRYDYLQISVLGLNHNAIIIIGSFHRILRRRHLLRLQDHQFVHSLFEIIAQIANENRVTMLHWTTLRSLIYVRSFGNVLFRVLLFYNEFYYHLPTSDTHIKQANFAC